MPAPHLRYRRDLYEGALFPGRALPGGRQIFGETKKGALFERMTNQKRRLLLLGERMGSSPISSRKSGLPIFYFFAETEARKTPEKADRMRFYTHPI